MTDLLWVAVIIAALCVVCFMAGRAYEESRHD